MGDYRPINVLNVSVKIISKVPDNKLKGIPPELIDEYQADFSKRRNILDCIATAQEVLQFVARHKERETGF